jgi:hypothetical protein
MTESGGHDHRPTMPSRDRYSAVVAALLDVRIDHPTQRFDAELDAALADGRIDASTARALRWWQRMSVRAAESYASTVVPAVLIARDEADEQATSDADEIAASWRQAGGAQAPLGAAERNVPGYLVAVPAEELQQVQQQTRPVQQETPRAEQTTRAIRAAFRGGGPELASGNPPVDPVATTVTSASTGNSARKDRRSHADPATSA